MTFDATTISPQASAEYIRTGKYYSSSDTLAQANHTLNALAAHGAALVPHGFGSEDKVLLTDVRDALEGAGVLRFGAVGLKRRARLTFAQAFRDGLAQREKGRSVLSASEAALRRVGGPEQALTLAASALQQTSRAPKRQSEADQLDPQLQLLLGALTQPDIAQAAAQRGGPVAVAALGAASAALVSGIRQRPAKAGTPEATQRLDLLDGIVVQLTRQARRAAHGAARELGQPAIYKAFELLFLDRKASKSSGAGDDADPSEPVEASGE
ncbi:MAG TPA: hypothetical protein VLS89_04470 [Candidatus Nanopelagicales bacterium]|nr:hypothetical protein [Candidatus Nanopelagicales bacterium]